MNKHEPPYLPPANKNWKTATNPFFPYSEKIHRVFDLFQKAKQIGTGNFFCFLINKNTHQTTFITLPNYAQIQDINNFMRKDIPDNQVLIMMDLRQSFDVQIRSGFMNPAELTSWEHLKECPMNCVDPNIITKLITYYEPAGYIPHLSKLSDVWKHPTPDSLPPKKYIDFRPRNHLTLVKT